MEPTSETVPTTNPPKESSPTSPPKDLAIQFEVNAANKTIQCEMETDDAEDLASWMEPVEVPQPSPIPPDNEDAENIYSDFPEDYRLPTTCQ